MVTIKAPAKINLTFEVLGKRADGYHEIRSVIQTISLCDRLHFIASNKTEVRSLSPGWSAESSLVVKALNLVRNTTGYKGGVEIEVEKNIPLTAGLGGDSSDAAAVLRGLNEVWELRLGTRKLSEMAARLGSDVGFFLRGGTCLMEGRGELIRPLPALPHRYVILVNPAVPRPKDKTTLAYARLKQSHYTDGHITQRLVNALEMKQSFTATQLFNTFENIFFTREAELNVYRSHLRKMGAPHVHLAGSGPALFTLIADERHAKDLYTRLKNGGMDVYLLVTGDCW